MKKIILFLMSSCLFSLSSYAQPACAYTSQVAGNTAAFSHVWFIIGTQTVDSIHLDYGDGNSNTFAGAPPTSTYTYSTPGTYNVCLTRYVTDLNAPQQLICTYCDSLTIAGPTSSCFATASYTSSVTSNNASFTNTSNCNGCVTTTYFWDFGDGSPPSNAVSPNHSYSSSGTYNVCLIVVGVDSSNGVCTDTICSPVTVTYNSPVGCQYTTTNNMMNYTFSQSLAIPFLYSLDSCTWDFGDGNTLSQYLPIPANTNHTYASPGTYYVCLTRYLSDLQNNVYPCTYCTTITVVGATGPCNASASFTGMSAGLIANFNNTSTCVGCTSTTYDWDFGDGNNSTLASPTHTYASAGTYNVCLTVTGIDSLQNTCIDTFCSTMTVTGGVNLPCANMNINAAYTSSVTGPTATFSNSSTCGGCLTTTYAWDFGDGNNSSLTNPVHSYASAGTYNVCLYVIGIDSMQNTCVDTFCNQVTTSGSSSPCSVTSSWTQNISGLSVSFNNTSTPCTNCTVVSYYWWFDDGNSSTLASPTHTYLNAGNYNVCLTTVVMDSLQNTCFDSVCNNVMVSGATNVQDLTYNVLKIYPNPTSSSINLEVPLNEEPESIKIVDVSGREVMEMNSFNQRKSIEIDLNSVSDGIYFLRLQTDRHIYTSTLMKE